MRKHAVVLLFGLLICGLTFAQGVAITQPLDGLVTSNATQRVNYVFADPGAVDASSITLNVDGTDYTVGGGLIWTPVNIYYDIDPGTWTEGVHTCDLWQANDTIGDPIAGVPLTTDFTVDLSGPFINARTPGIIGELEPITTTNRVEPISIEIMDDFGFIDPTTIEVMIDGMWLTMGDPGVYISEIAGGYLFEFFPDSAGIIWEENDWIEVELLTAQDSPDYGDPNTLQDLADNAYGFFVDADGPECYPISPVPFFREVAYLGCSDEQVIWSLKDENGLDLTTLGMTVNAMVYNWGDYRIEVDTIDQVPALVDTVIDSLIIPWDTTLVVLDWIVLEAEIIFTPNPQWYESVVYTVHPPMCDDIYGNPATGWYWGFYPWTDWMFMFDNTGPTISNTFPPIGYVTRDFQQEISFDVEDAIGAVNPSTLHFIVRTASTIFYEITWWSEVFNPELTWDGTTFTFHPDIAGITFPQGDTIFCTVWDIMDSIEFCDANHAETLPITWTFYVADGPMADGFIPDDDEYSSCQNQTISFELLDPDGIDPLSVEFVVEGLHFTVNTEYHIIDTFWVGGFPIVHDTIVHPFYQATATRFVLNPDLIPAGLLEYYDAREINCSIISAQDALGNDMWGGPVSWRFWIDYSGPYVGPADPVDGGIAGGPYPVFSLEIYDEVCGMIYPNSVTIQVEGVNYNPLIHPGVTWDDIPGGGRVTVDCEPEGLYYPHGSTLHACLTTAHDNPEQRCSLWGNEAIGLPYCWEFTIDNNPPDAVIVQPLIDEVTACPRQTIIVEVTDDYGVDPAYFQMIVNDIVYDWGDPRLTWDGTYLTYTPTSDYPEGSVEWSLARVGDVAGNVDATTPIAGATFIADYSAPSVLNTIPMDGCLVTVVPDFIEMIIDDPAGVDPLNADVTIDVYTDETTFVSYNITDAVFPGVFAWDDLTMTFSIDLAIAGIVFDYETYEVLVSATLPDNPDYRCPDANVLLDYQFGFGMNPGWEVPLDFWATGDTLPRETYTFGAYVGGTDNYDIGLDMLLPPPPPTETPLQFVSPGDGSLLLDDFRGLDTETWTWQMFTGTQEGCIYWDPADLPDLGSFVLNGFLDMRGEDHYCFAAGEMIEISVRRNILMLGSGWNLVSVPVNPIDPDINAVFGFPGVSMDNIWEYTGGSIPYVHPAIVQPGHAYFVLYMPVDSLGHPDPLYFTVPGAPLTTYTRVLGPGWQTIGSVYDFGGVDFTSPDDIPDGSCEPIAYGLDPITGGYYTSDVIVAGNGYWNLVNPIPPFGSAELTVTVGYPFGPKVIPTVYGDPDWTTTLSFNGEGSSEITIGHLDEATIGFERGLDMPIPPALPGATFDVYIEATRYGRMLTDIRDKGEWVIVVDAETPVELTWDGDAPEDLVLIGGGREIEINNEGSTVIEPGRYVAKRRISVPDDFALHGAAPNPFNAACGITFDIPKTSDVSIEVYDLLGKKVNTLTSGEFEPGTHRVVWSGQDDYGRDVSSGVYLYKMTAGEFKATGRMVLLR